MNSRKLVKIKKFKGARLRWWYTQSDCGHWNIISMCCIRHPFTQRATSFWMRLLHDQSHKSLPLIVLLFTWYLLKEKSGKNWWLQPETPWPEEFIKKKHDHWVHLPQYHNIFMPFIQHVILTHILSNTHRHTSTHSLTDHHRPPHTDNTLYVMLAPFSPHFLLSVLWTPAPCHQTV